MELISEKEHHGMQWDNQNTRKWANHPKNTLVITIQSAKSFVSLTIRTNKKVNKYVWDKSQCLPDCFFFFLFFSVIEFQIHRNMTHPEYNRFKRNVWIFFNFCSSSKCIAYLTISLRFGLDFIYLFICLLPRISSCLQLFQPLMKLINK